MAIEEAVRKSCYASESSKYDFSRVMSLLKDNFQGREAAVFLENVLMDDTKVSETVVPAVGAEMLQEALKAAGKLVKRIRELEEAKEKAKQDPAEGQV